MNQFDNEVSSTLKEIAERVETPPYLKDRIDKELLRRCPEYRKKIAVIFGGCSPEYSVSLQSAYAVGKLKKSSMNEVNRALAVSVGLSKFYLCQKECAEHLNQIAENNTRQ